VADARQQRQTSLANLSEAKAAVRAVAQKATAAVEASGKSLTKEKKR